MQRFVSFSTLFFFACVGDTSGLGPGGNSAEDAGPSADAPRTFSDAPLARQDAAGSDVRDALAPDSALFEVGDFWTLERKRSVLSAPKFFLDGVTAYVRVEISLDHACEHAGPIDVEQQPNGQFDIQAHVWLHHVASPGDGDCYLLSDKVERSIPLPPFSLGTIRAIEAISGQWVEIEIRDGPPCTRGGAPISTCRQDCDCQAEMSCLAEQEAGFVSTGCGIPCNPVITGCCGRQQPEVNLECPLEMVCVSEPGYVSGRCEMPWDDAFCSFDNPCPPGMFCPNTAVPRRCHWSVQLNSQTRHPCETSASCAPGLVCVLDPGALIGRCEIPCFSNRMECPPAHDCRSSEGWVCEWQGE